MAKNKHAKRGIKLKGPSHKKGGIPAVVKGSAQPLELEGGEIIINKEASAQHCEKLSEINQSAGNGVAIECSPCTHDEKTEFGLGGLFKRASMSQEYVEWARQQTVSDLLHWAGFQSEKDYEQTNDTQFSKEDIIVNYYSEIQPVYDHLKGHALLAYENGGQIRKMCDVGTEIQTILFNRDKFNIVAAKNWLKDHDFKYGFPDITENNLRFRQADPDTFKKDSFRTITLTPGIQGIIACPVEKQA